MLERILNNDYYLSQSRLKNLINGGILGFLYPKKIESDKSNIGLLVESLFFEGKIDDKFLISNFTKPTGRNLKIIKDVISSKKDFKEALIEAYNKHNVKKPSIDVFIENYEKTYKDYYDAVSGKNDKIIISNEDYTKSLDILSRLQKDINIIKLLTLSDNQIPFYQEKIFFEYLGEKCIAIPDYYIVDEDKKEITIIDLKTTSKTIIVSARDNRWDIQAAFYSKALKSKYPDYKINDFIFIVVRTDLDITPTIIVCTDKDIEIGEHGIEYQNISFINGKEYISKSYIPGFKYLIELFKWHKENEIWDKNKDVYTGKISLNLFNIK